MPPEIKFEEEAKATTLVSRIGFLSAAIVMTAIMVSEFTAGYVTGGEGAFRAYRAAEPIVFWMVTSAYSAFIAMLFYLGLRRDPTRQKKSKEPNQTPEPTAPSGRGSS